MSLNNIQPSPLSDPRIIGSRSMQDADLSASGGVMQNTPIQVESTRRNPAPEDTRKPKTFIPYNCKLIEESAGVYSVTVDKGCISEKLLTAVLNENALLTHICTNHFDGDDLRKFPISVNDGVFVVFSETPDGNIDPLSDIKIEIKPKDEKSLNYIRTKQDSKYYYKLAELVTDGGVTKLVRYLAGSNIYKESGLTADFYETTCEPGGTPGDYTAVQTFRMRFLSGKLAGINESKNDIPYSLNNIATVDTTTICTDLE